MTVNNLVSIIIPVYNAETSLDKCITSILHQTYKEIEVLLINDGSTDNSAIMCEQYATKDRRIHVIHQHNAGPSAARNTGIQAAMGTYIQFIDADDYIEPDMTKRLVKAMNQYVQLAICGNRLIKNTNGKVQTINNIPAVSGVYPLIEFMKSFGTLYHNNLMHSPCNKLYRTDLIKKFNLYFMEDVRMGEDLLFNLEYLNVCTHISIMKDPLYNYVIYNNHSLTGSFKKGFFENQKMLFEKTRTFLVEKDVYTEENKSFVGIRYTTSMIGCFNNVFHRSSPLSSMQRREYICRIVKDHWVRKNIEHFKHQTIQKRLIGWLIKYQSIKSIYWIFKMKSMLRSKIEPFFISVKIVNH